MAALGRNDPCHCGSGKKYKKCHLREDEAAAALAKPAADGGADPVEDAPKPAAVPKRAFDPTLTASNKTAHKKTRK